MEEQPAAQPSRPERLPHYAPTDLASRIFYLRIRVRQQKGTALPSQWMRDAACSPATSEDLLMLGKTTVVWNNAEANVIFIAKE